jgi:hypothetical protein
VRRCDRDAREDWPKLLERKEAVFESYKMWGLESSVWRPTMAILKRWTWVGLERGSASRRGEREVCDDEV